jgi:hypothetical protein
VSQTGIPELDGEYERQLTEAAIEKARAETVAQICAWLRGTWQGDAMYEHVLKWADAIERGDWKAK